ncbi:MAG: hypothetical protein IJZ31_07375 [Bacteroidaceae bacterium]|nr:hypothetical protein [Bacteroidaceae bacterium]
MNVQLSYNEILGYVEDKFHVRPTVEVVDDQTLSVSYKISRFVPTINVDVHIDLVSKELIALSYDCSSIVNGLLGGVVGFMQERIPREQIELSTDNKKVLVHLDKVEQLKKVFDVVVPTDITFYSDSIVLNMDLA